LALFFRSYAFDSRGCPAAALEFPQLEPMATIGCSIRLTAFCWNGAYHLNSILQVENRDWALVFRAFFD
jgi:hypothetical protein